MDLMKKNSDPSWTSLQKIGPGVDHVNQKSDPAWTPLRKQTNKETNKPRWMAPSAARDLFFFRFAAINDDKHSATDWVRDMKDAILRPQLLVSRTGL